MQKALKKITGIATELLEKSVTLSLQSQTAMLRGRWTWDMQSNTVYCSDVMSFPENFIGTKGIVHPDDLCKLRDAIELAEDKKTTDISFRIITTYGEVKTISGKDISIDHSEKNEEESFSAKELWEEALEKFTEKKENDFFQLRYTLSEITEWLHSIGSYLLSKTTSQAWYSDNVFRIYNLAPKSLNANAYTFHSFIHADDKGVVIDAFEKAFREEIPLEIEYRISLTDSEIKFVQHTLRWMFDSNGHLICCGIIRDITRERNVIDELLKAEARTSLHQQLLKFSEQQINSAFWHVNLVTRKAFYSDNYWRILGLKPTSLFNLQNFLNLVHVDDRERVKVLFDKMYAEYVMADCEFRIIRPDGKIRILKQSGRFLVDPNKEPVMIGVVSDITVQRSLETKINELNETISLNDFITGTIEGTYDVSSLVWDKNGAIQASDGFLRMTGIKPAANENLSNSISKIIYPDDKNIWNEIKDSLSKQQVPGAVEFRMITKGKIKSVKISFFQINHEKYSIAGLLQDVTFQNSLQEKFAENQTFSSLLLDSVTDIIVFTNTDHTITSWNEKAEHITGITKENALYQNLFDVLPALNEEKFISQLSSVLNGEEIHSTQTDKGYFLKPHQYWLLPLKDENGNVTGVLHVVHDISRQLQLQSQLHERLNFIENLVESSVDRIVVLDKEMNYLYWNQKAEEHYGIEKEEIVGKNILEVFPAFKNDPGYHEFRKVLRGETIFFPAKIVDENSEYAETYLTPIKDENGNVTAVLWIVHDLSKEYELQREKKIAEEKIREQAHYLQRITETTPDMISIMELETRQLKFLNEQTFKANGFNPDELVKVDSRTLSVTHPDDRKTLDDYFNSFCNASDKDVISAEYRAKTEKGDWQWFHVRGKVFQRNGTGKATHIVNVIENISDRKKIEQEILRLKDEIAQKATDKYHSLFNSIDEGFHIIELIYNRTGKAVDFRYLETNQSFERHTGLKDACGKLGSEIAPGTEECWFDAYDKVVKTGESIRFESYNSFTQRWYSTYAFRVSEKTPTHVAVLFSDITSRKQTEQQQENLKAALKQQIEERASELTGSRQLLQTILDNSTNRITVFDCNYRFIAWNRRCEQIHGKTKEQVIGKTIFEMFPGVENNPVFVNAQEKSIKGEYVHVPSVQDTYTGAYLELFYVPLKNESGETYAVLNIMHDVTNYIKQTEALNTLNKKLENKNAELEQKNEEITHFSFVASHDMKEPLRKIHTFSDWLLNEESEFLSPKGKGLVEKISAAVLRMNLLIEDILVLTKINSDTHQEEHVDLNNVLQKVLDDLSDAIRQTQTEVIADRLPVIKGNDNQLFYLFKNLITNAIKFQKPGNVPQIKITAEITSSNEIKGREDVDQYLKLCFIDNGFGFDSRYSKKIFQVFQRLHNKNEFEGTGIGLAICKKIMENHRGLIDVQTEEGKGSVFICYFPLQ